MNVPREQQPILLAQPAATSWIVPGRPVDRIGSLKNHRKLALAIAGSVVFLGLVAALLFGRAKYEAVATVHVVPTYDTRLAAGLDGSMIPNIEYRNFVQQQVFEIANPETVIEALKLLGPKASLWQLPNETDQHAAERLLEYLKVEWIPDTFLIKVSLRGTKSHGLAEIVNTVVSAYLSRQARRDLSGADARVSLLETRRSGLQQEADGERAELSQLAQELGVSTFTASTGDPYDRKLADANVALERQQRQLIVEQAYLAALQVQESRPTDSDVNSLAQRILLNNQDLAAQKAQLGKQREATFLQLQGLAPNHPGRPVLERQIADIDNEGNLIDSEAMKRARSILLGTRSAKIHDRIAEAQTRVDEAQRARDGIQQEVTALKSTVASFGAKYNHALAVHEQYESHLKALSEIDDRVDMLRLQSQSPGIASLELAAKVPDKPEGGKRLVILVFSIVLAGLLAGLVPTLIDLTDSRVKSARELETLLQLPVLGSTQRLDTQSARDALRRIALSIIHERKQAGTRVFVMTAVEAKAGTTSLTLALANELTELNVPTVAIEANSRYPDIRYQKLIANGADPARPSLNGSELFEGKQPRNGNAVVAKVTSPDACVHAIVSASDSLPDRIPICQRQKHERLAVTCVHEALELALASHDVVLMDAPPVLGSADTAMLVQNPAGVIVLVRAQRDRLTDVTAAVQELTRLSPPVVGVVVRGDRFENGVTTSTVETELADSRLSISKQRAQRPVSKARSEIVTHYG